MRENRQRASGRRLILALAGTAAAMVSTAAGQNPPTLSDKLPWGGFTEPARLGRAKGWRWDHEVRVWLPPSYRSSTRTYPTLWVTDNNLEVVRAALVGTGFGSTPELIVVAVGAPLETGVLEFQRLSAGEAEAVDPRLAAAQGASTVALVAERLASRKYPSLELSVRVFPGEDHLTVLPVA